jgi:polyhydroxyalkanoate synthesis regulator phasin
VGAMKKSLAAMLVASGMVLGSLLTMVLNPIGAASALVGSGSSSAHESIIQQALDTLVGKGTITKGQAQAVQNQVHSLEQQHHKDFHGFGPAAMGGFGHSFGMGRDSFQQIMSLLKIDPQTLFQDLASGKSIADIAASKGVPLSSVEQAMITAANQQIDQAVKNGWMTAAQAATAKAKVPSEVDKAVHATMPAGFGMGPNGHTFHMVPPGAPAPTPPAPPKGTTSTTTN